MDESIPPKGDKARMRLELEWPQITELVSQEVRDLLLIFLQENSAELRIHYQTCLEEDEEIQSVLGSMANQDDFAEIFLRDISDLLANGHDSAATFYEQQAEIGSLMARIGLPPSAISRVMRKFSVRLLASLAQYPLDQSMLVETVIHIVNTIGLSLEVRDIRYQQDIAARVRADETYRLHSLGQNLTIERERQRALLMEWGHNLLTAFHQSEGLRKLPRLWISEFGLWLNHKARLIFERTPNLAGIIAAVDRIDKDLVPALEQIRSEDRESVSFVVTRIEEEIADIRFELNGLFELHIEVEKGRDPLTHLLGRQFMPSILMREIKLQKTPKDQGLCLLLIDVDCFKAINDQYGHKAGDVVLGHIAQAITNCTRPSDFVFRYGGEEIIVVLVDCVRDMAMQTAERIRADIEDMRVALPEGGDLQLTVSIGVAAHEGEFDYEVLIGRADKAMYRAKSSGKNRIEMG
ncbi:MAG: GGDEF domain-containing protein [Alphaproteobacteria bacterium]|nr:GGDEF domain-containing protein [Alphaproteobacteria bacterium]